MTRALKRLEDDLSSAERKEQIATGQQPALRTVDRRRKGICTLRARETVQKLSNFSAAVANCSRDRTATEQTADRLVKKCHSRRRQAGELDRFYGAPSAHLARARVPIGPSAARVKKPLKATWTNKIRSRGYYLSHSTLVVHALDPCDKRIPRRHNVQTPNINITTIQ